MICQLTIKVEKASLEDNVSEIFDTFLMAKNNENKTLPFMNRLYKILPELELVNLDLTNDSLRKTIYGLISSEYTKNDECIENKITHFQTLVQLRLEEAVNLLVELFEFNEKIRFPISCSLGIYNPFPRNVITKQYWLHYNISDEIFLRASIHEINHMIFFEKWKQLFGDSNSLEPVYPDILWFMEELLIEPTLNDIRIQEVLSIRHDAYDSLKNIEIQSISLTKHIQELYDTRKCMDQFLLNTYAFLQENYELILNSL
jgi:hypothetical protein